MARDRIGAELAERLPYFDLATRCAPYTLACAGQKDEARKSWNGLQWLGRERFMMRAFMPEAYLAVGLPHEALAALQAGMQPVAHGFSRCWPILA